MSEQTADSKKKPDGTWLPVIMSLVVYPGVGQWMQKRKTAAAVYMAFFTFIAALFTWTFYLYFREVLPILKNALLGNLDGSEVIPPLSDILKPFAIVLFIYAGNAVDVLRGRYQVIRDSKQN